MLAGVNASRVESARSYDLPGPVAQTGNLERDSGSTGADAECRESEGVGRFFAFLAPSFPLQ